MANVWKQLFHETIPNLAYTANTIGQSRFGVENIVSSLFKNGLTLLGTLVAITPLEVPPVIARYFGIVEDA